MKRKNNNVIALDIGTCKIAAICAHIDKQGEANTQAQLIRSSGGIRAGVVTNLKSAEENVINCIYAIENEIGKSVKDVDLAICPSITQSYYINQSLAINNSQIQKQDIKKLIDKALQQVSSAKMTILHYFPIEYILDDTNIIDDPEGLHAEKLAVQMHIIAAKEAPLMNLYKPLNNCHIGVQNSISTIYASGLACLNDNEKEMGSVIIDIGASCSSFAIFLDNKCFYTGRSLMGGADITSDISKNFSINLRDAEKIKILYGNADKNLIQREEIIRLGCMSEIHSNIEINISTLELSEIISSRLFKIFSEIKEQIKQLDMDNLLSKRVVLTGGSALMHGIANIAGEAFDKNIRIAEPQKLNGFSESSNLNIYSNVIGMVIERASTVKARYNNFSSNDNGLFKKAISWVKENI